MHSGWPSTTSLRTRSKVRHYACDHHLRPLYTLTCVHRHLQIRTYTHTRTRLTAFFQDNLGRPVPERGKTTLDLNEARDDGDGSGISRTICKQSAPRSRQITTPTPHQSICTGLMLFLTPNQQCQSTEGGNKFPQKTIPI